MNHSINHIDSNLINDIQLVITTATSITLRDNWFGENVISPFSRLYYVKNGSGKIVKDGEEIILEPGHIYLVPVGVKFSHYPRGSMEKIYFHFNISKPDGYDLLKNVKKIKILECGTEYIERIYRLFESKTLIDTFVLKSNILGDISKMIADEDMGEDDSVKYSEKVYSAIRMISASPTIRMTVSDIAKKLFISESCLSKNFKKEVGITIGDYIDRMVMYGAQTALIETKDSISTISERFGFNDRFYFSRRFKQLFAETPSEYRKRLKLYND